MNRLSRLLLILLTGAIFFFSAAIYIDPDFGWHVKLGSLILEKGFPKTDPFSYTMPSFPFVDHEWLTNIIYYYLYTKTGLKGMSFLLTAAGFGVILLIKVHLKSRFFLAPLLLTLGVMLSFWGIRPQIESLFLTAILLLVLIKEKLWLRLRLFSPFYFMVWANLHGGFAAGLLIFYVFLLFRSIIQKKIIISDLALGVISLGATLINPYGLGLWEEVWRQISDGNLRWTIEEWMPLILNLKWYFLISFLPLLALSGLLILQFYSKLPLPLIVLYIIFLVAALANQRHVPLWLLPALFLIVQGLNLFYQQIKLKKHALSKFWICYKALALTSFFFLIIQGILIISNLNSWRQEKIYPYKAVQKFLKEPLEGRLFANYGWGGYLIWQTSEKVFVDGRMPSWRHTAPEGESPAAFDEYNKILKDTDGLTILDKYNVMFVLWLPETKPAKENLLEKINGIENNIPSLNKRLESAGWQKIYSDQTAVLYKR